LIRANVKTGQTAFPLKGQTTRSRTWEAALDYRLYFLDARGRVRDRVDFECEDDGHALRAAEQQADGRAMELWHRAVLIREFPLPETPKGP